MAGAALDDRPDRPDSRQSNRALRRQAASLRGRSLRLTGRSEALLTRSRRLRLRSELLGVSVDGAAGGEVAGTQAPPRSVDGAPVMDAPTSQVRAAGAILGFRLRGTIEGRPVVADWTPDGLVASDPLMVRAGIVVRLGDTFVGAGGRELGATLEGGPTQALMTFMRACDRVESVSVNLPAASDAPRPA